MEIIKRVCTKCNLEKGVKDFYKNKTFKIGISYWCKNCHSLARHGKPYSGTLQEVAIKRTKSIEFSNGTKICTRCKETKDMKLFGKGSKSKLATVCRECNVYFDKFKCYGLTKEEYLDLFIKQNNKCKICNKSKEEVKVLCVDHCHTTGKVRGLLCSQCNKGLGYLKDNISLLEKAIEYLKNSKEIK